MSFFDEIGKRTQTFIVGGFTLVTALSWNSTIRDGIHSAFPVPKENFRANLLYSVVMTIILIIMIYLLTEGFTTNLERFGVEKYATGPGHPHIFDARQRPGAIEMNPSGYRLEHYDNTADTKSFTVNGPGNPDRPGPGQSLEFPSKRR